MIAVIDVIAGNLRCHLRSCCLLTSRNVHKCNHKSCMITLLPLN